MLTATTEPTTPRSILHAFRPADHTPDVAPDHSIHILQDRDLEENGPSPVEV